MSERYSQVLELTKARLKEFYREPGAVFWVFGFPVLLAVGLGIAFRNRPPETPRVAIEETPETSWIREALEGSEDLEILVIAPAAAADALRVGSVDVVLKADAGRRVTFRFDPMRSEARLAKLAAQDALERALGRVDLLTAEAEVVTEPGSRYIDYLLPGLIGMNLMGSSMWGIGYGVVLSRKRRQLKRLAATPMRRSTFLLGYLLSRLTFLFAEVAALLFFGWLVFDVAVQGSLVAVGVVAVLGSASFAGIALLIAARVESLEAVSGWLNFVMLPMWLLCGSFFSYERFPEFAQPIIRGLPLTALNDALRSLVNRGEAITASWLEVSVLFAWGLVSFVIAGRVFRWQ